MRGEKRVWGVAIPGWVLLSALCWWLYPPTMSDTMSRYAPMADAFARGEWYLAFHPRFGVLFQCVSGSLAFLGLPGDVACQATAIGMLIVSAVFMWKVADRLFGLEAAWWTFGIVVLCDFFLNNSMDGLRESGKCLSLAFVAWGVVSGRSRWVGAGVFVLITIVSYGFAVATALLGTWAVWVFARGLSWRKLVWPGTGWSAGTVVCSLMVHAYTGYWLPVPHFIRFLEKLT